MIADQPLESLVPLQVIRRGDKDEVVCTQWDMGDVEKAGLLKMDFLGLRNLTTLEAAVRIIGERHPDAPLDLDKLPLDDRKTFELLQRGETKGVFQLESAGIRDLLVKMKPDRFADIIATNALYRPGPLNGGMVDEYVDVKNGRKLATYIHPVLKEVLEETYGVMVYQEQVMRILNRLGGIELSKAYATIKAISKKKTDFIAESRGQFVQGAVERGLDREKALKIFDLIEFFGGYGFNKSHSTAYALVAYQTAYLKAHYPDRVHGRGTLVGDGRGGTRQVLRRAHRRLPADGHRGAATQRERGGGVVPGGQGGSDPLRPGGDQGGGGQGRRGDRQGERAGGPVPQPGRFLRAGLDPRGGQQLRRDLDSRGGVRLPGGSPRAASGDSPRAIQAGQAKQDDRRRGQRGLFDDLEGRRGQPATVRETARAMVRGTATPMAWPTCPKCPSCSDAELLGGEKKALGFYMSSHPADSPRAAAPGPGEPSRGRARRPARQDRGHPGRHDRQRPGPERAEEPVRAAPGWPS